MAQEFQKLSTLLETACYEKGRYLICSSSAIFSSRFILAITRLLISSIGMKTHLYSPDKTITISNGSQIDFVVLYNPDVIDKLMGRVYAGVLICDSRSMTNDEQAKLKHLSR